jgi:predicted anti-sigma-YlaC factor YlaD
MITSNVQDKHWEGADISAYLDGELSREEAIDFEEHLKICKECNRELATQRQLLCTLDFALNKSIEIDLPKNFAEIVSVRAQSDMRGVRSSIEHKRAFHFCLFIGITALIFLNITAGHLILVLINGFFKMALSLWSLVHGILTGAGATLAVVLRAVGRYFIFELQTLPLTVSLFFAIIINYHRSKVAELKDR